MLDLASHIARQSNDIRASLPEKPDLPLSIQNAYQKRLNAFDDEVLESCEGSQHGLALCTLVQHFPRWQEIRMAERLLKK